MSLKFVTRVISLENKKHGNSLLAIPKLYFVPCANLTSKEWTDPSIKKPAPWPYKTKKFTYNRAFFDSTLKRFDENTKVIVVEGNIGAGKTAFAKELAEAFDMVYFPEPSMDRLYITPYGHNLRDLDPILPPTFKSCDLQTFYKNPHDLNVMRMQFQMYRLRLEDNVNALAHVFNTGQGVVLERCAFSDFVFWKAMHNAGYITKRVMEYYNDVLNNTLDELLKPHLIVYLDISPEVALERIRKRNNPIEVNSPVLTHKYLSDIEYTYKQEYLKEMEPHCELLIYDWSNYGDVEVVVEDIEKIDFDRFSKYDIKLKGWRMYDDWAYGVKRRRYSNDREKILGYTNIFRPQVTELYHPGEEVQEYEELMRSLPGGRYVEGYNKEMGDSVWFKLKHKSYWHKQFYYW